MNSPSLNILQLPEIAVEKIFSFLSYDEISRNRLVCRKFNEYGSKLLTRGFYQLEKRHQAIYKKVKSLLPRRESERRVHPLSRHCDVLQAIETRISMLSMTYGKYMDCAVVCFIPGKVLDELKNVLSLVESDQNPPRTHTLLQELRDLSSMAMEHFDEHILPKLKEQFDRRLSPSALLNSKNLATQQSSFSSELHLVKAQSNAYKQNISCLTQNTHRICFKLKRHHCRLKLQSFRLKKQERKLQEQAAKIQEQDAAIAEMKKHISECNQRCNDLANELARARSEMVTSTQTKPSSTIVASPPKIFKSNIKPRSAHILPKSYLNLHLDTERKRKSNVLPEIPLKRNKTPEVDSFRKKTVSDKGVLNFKKEKSVVTVSAENKDKSTTRDILMDKATGIYNKLMERIDHQKLMNSRKRKITEDLDLS